MSSRRMEIMRIVSEAQELDQVLFLNLFCKQCFTFTSLFVSGKFRMVLYSKKWLAAVYHVKTSCRRRRLSVHWDLGNFPILSFTLNTIFLDPTI